MLLPLATLLALAAPALSLWPIPRALTTGNATLLLNKHFLIDLDPSLKAVPDLTAAMGRVNDQLRSDKLGRLVPGRGRTDAPSFPNAKSIERLILKTTDGQQLKPIAEEAIKPIGEKDESYILTVPDDGSEATLMASTSLGLFRGLTTFGQLWYTYGETIYALGLPLKVNDQPAYVRSSFFPPIPY
jgi:hexosaminidase